MAENTETSGCLQRDGAEHERYAKARRSFNLIWKERYSAQPKLLEAILYKDKFDRAYKRVKANKGVPGVDGMTIEEVLPYLQKHQQELTTRIYRRKYTPSPVRRVEIPKPDGGVRKLGIPTVIDRTLQQAITQQLVPIYEPLFADGSYGYRPNRDAKGAILKVKEYAEQGYTYAVVLDLSKYFDTINHEILIKLLRKNVKVETASKWKMSEAQINEALSYFKVSWAVGFGLITFVLACIGAFGATRILKKHFEKAGVI